jgi:hypothetical protein
MRSTIRNSCVLAGALALASCAGPSRGEIDKQNAEARLLSSAHAVHMPPGIESCVGVTLRLADPNAPGDAIKQREELATRIKAEEVSAAMQAVNVDRCKDIYLEAVAEGRTSPEPMKITMHYGVDPAGKVCAAVEKQRMEPIDPAANGLLETAATCLKESLFAAQFPAGRVEDKDRVILTYNLVADPAMAKKTE